VSAVPRIDGATAARVRVDGEPRSPIDPSPHACRFSGRCPCEVAQCTEEAPALDHVSALHSVACHLVEKRERPREVNPEPPALGVANAS
jgi:oligopeptide/dipeptide ABC transporter ATP-binding protein